MVNEELIENFAIKYSDKHVYNFEIGWKSLLGFYQICEAETKQYFCDVIKDDWNVIDVGANIGMFSKLFTHLTKGDIFLIEASEVNMEMLKQNVENSQNVYFLKEYISEDQNVNEGIIHYLWTNASILREEGKFKTNTLDNIFSNYSKSINLIKIDIDGWDYQCLVGSKELILRDSPIICIEVMDETLKLSNKTTQDVINLMSELNYINTKILDTTNYIFERAFKINPVTPSLTDKFLLNEILRLKDLFKVKTFIETGTHVGASAIIASNYFDNVYTCENEPNYFQVAKKNIIESGVKNINYFYCSSLDMFENILPLDEKIIVFLDAHADHDFPLLGELEKLKKNFIKPIIIIHDFFVPDHFGNAKFQFDIWNGNAINLNFIWQKLIDIYGDSNNFEYYFLEKQDISGVIYIIPNE